MIKATFSEADIKLLQENENVELVTQESIQFTLPFKKRLYAMKLQGIPLKTIIREAGIDPRILGDKRIENLSDRVNKIDFLKKLRMADMEAQKQWESKLRLK